MRRIDCRQDGGCPSQEEGAAKMAVVPVMWQNDALGGDRSVRKRFGSGGMDSIRENW